MRRTIVLVLTASLALVALLAAGPSSTAAGPLTGRLVDGVAPGSPAVSGMTVRLRELADGGGPGPIVDVDVTGPGGGFSLSAAGSSADEFYVQVLAGNYQGGWIGADWVEGSIGNAVTYSASASLGDILAVPAYIRGVVVNSVTKNPVSGVRVTARSQDHISEVDGADLTDSNGVFRINGLTCEDDCYLKVNGSEKGYETGFRACNAKVVATWPNACASPLGRIGRVFLDRL
ncbi:hypothetical protein [Nocardioides sp.]|uniref:hypothetical protein n=1 Tax=Nocardioides sp. TaxID=35761 RepID=UPI0031FE5311|nr:hypothetical protein [Nocardioides sp.]